MLSLKIHNYLDFIGSVGLVNLYSYSRNRIKKHPIYRPT